MARRGFSGWTPASERERPMASAFGDGWEQYACIDLGHDGGSSFLAAMDAAEAGLFRVFQVPAHLLLQPAESRAAVERISAWLWARTALVVRPNTLPVAYQRC